MPLETAAIIEELVAANPPGTDGRSQGDDHIRLIKTAVRSLMAGVPGAASPQTAQIVSGAITLTRAVVFLTSEIPTQPDTINTINTAGTYLGGLVILRPNSGSEPITVAHQASGAGRIILDSQASHLMFNVDHFMILFRDSSDRWRELIRKPLLMTQEIYNIIHPVGKCEIFGSIADPNTLKPSHIVATWVNIDDTGRYLRIHQGTPLNVGGANVQSLPNHTHPVSITTGQPSSEKDADSGGTANYPHPSHTHPVVGNTGNPNTNPNINITPLFRDVRMWQRTA